MKAKTFRLATGPLILFLLVFPLVPSTGADEGKQVTLKVEGWV